MCITYQLITWPDNKATFVDISEKEYLQYQKAKEVLEHALLIEQKYDTVIHNFLELEKAVLSIAADYSVKRNINYEDFFNVRQTLNIKLINFFAATYLYLFSVSHNAKHCVQNDIICDEIKKWKSEEYDNNPNYRFMDTFRNYAHHYEFPVNKTSQGAKNVNNEDRVLQEYYVEFFVNQKVLIEDFDFKKKALEGFDEEIDLNEASKGYVKSINIIHKKIRDNISESVNESREMIEKLLETHPSPKLLGNHGIVNLLKKEGALVIEDIALLLEWDDIRIKFQKQNRSLNNLEIRYVTSGVKRSK